MKTNIAKGHSYIPFSYNYTIPSGPQQIIHPILD